MKRLWIVFVIGIVCLGCQPEISQISTSTPPAPTKQVIQAGLPFIERWRWSGFVYALSNPPQVIIIKDQVVVAAKDDNGYKIVAFNAHTGDILWESERIQGIVRSLHADNNRVYMGTITYVQAFDLKTGKVLWTGAEQPVSKKGALDVYSKSEQLEVYDFDEGILYLLDVQTGQMIKKIEQPFIFFYRNDIYYTGVCGYGYKTHCLKAVEASKEKTLWSHDFKGIIYLWPTFIEDKMFINAGGYLFAVDTKEGDIIWQSTDSIFITSIAVGDRMLYAIRKDATIVSFDPETGEQMGMIEIIPNQTHHDVGRIDYYTIAASDKYIAAYYGDSHELIVFEKK